MSKRKTICPTCKQDMSDKPREGWHCLDCPQCGQGLYGAAHVSDVLTRLGRAKLGKAKPAGRVLARTYARKVYGHWHVCTREECAYLVECKNMQARGYCRRVEVREVKGGGK